MLRGRGYSCYLCLLLCLPLLWLVVACSLEEAADVSGDESGAISAEGAEDREPAGSREDDQEAEAAGSGKEDEEAAPVEEEEGGDAASVREFEEDSCPFELFDGDDIRCGYLYVPEDRADPEGREIELAVAIIGSRSEKPKADPIIYLEGGPGGSPLFDPDSWLESPLRDEREIILLDQRGTGFSLPSLNCIEMEEDEEDPLGAAKACRDRLAKSGVNLAAYNSANNAADVNDLRLALGYDEWNVLGISYGTRLALTVMRDFPEGIRSVVLDSVYPPNIDAYTEQALNNADAIQAMLQGCAANAACNDAYPELETKFYELIAQLNEKPVEVDQEEIYGDQIVDQLVSSLYDTSAIPELPFIIHEAYNQNYDPLLDLIAPPEDKSRTRSNDFSRSLGAERLKHALSGAEGSLLRLERRRFQDGEGDISDSEGMFYSVECHEEMPFGDLDQAEKLVAKYPTQVTDGLLAGLEQEYQVCEIWGAGEADQIESEAVRSDIPTLVLAGEYDPVTPPSWAKSAANTLSNHHYFEIPAGGHALMDAGECPLGIIVAFIDNPNAQPDGTCVGNMKPTFVVP
ncbi:MAG: alpha/beta fold hydrolase [Ardenticatenaceae bacterium]